MPDEFNGPMKALPDGMSWRTVVGQVGPGMRLRTGIALPFEGVDLYTSRTQTLSKAAKSHLAKEEIELMLLFSGTQIASCSIERHIGETVADAVCAMGRARVEYEDGALQAETKERCVELIACLYRLWRYTPGYESFDDAARHYGKVVLPERFGDASDAALDKLISWPLDTLAAVVRKLVN
jgi:hypothetical protein